MLLIQKLPLRAERLPNRLRKKKETGRFLFFTQILRKNDSKTTSLRETLVLEPSD
jgi:hypothetical protein